MLRARLPAGLELDVFNGQTWLGLVGAEVMVAVIRLKKLATKKRQPRGAPRHRDLLRNHLPTKDAKRVEFSNKNLVIAHGHMRPRILVADRSLIKKFECFGICFE